jgi:hypothetical protein
MSVAHKYALLQVFCIPTDEPKDPEHESPQPEPLKYIGTPTQKKILVEAFRKSGIKEPAQMKSISEKMQGLEMDRIEDVINQFLGA